jgi:hypothetical protein
VWGRATRARCQWDDDELIDFSEKVGIESPYHYHLL